MLLRKRHRIQVGRGIGSILSSFWRLLAPLAKRLFKFGGKAVTSKTAKRIGKTVASTALEKGVSAVNDAISGEPIKDTVKKHIKEAGEDIFSSGVSEVAKTLIERQEKKRKGSAGVHTGGSKKKAKLKPSELVDVFSEKNAAR